MAKKEEVKEKKEVKEEEVKPETTKQRAIRLGIVPDPKA